METWPSIFPAPTLSLSGNTESSTISSRMETGRVRRRRRFTMELRTYRATWEFSDFEFGMFQSWFLHKINDGADSFNVTFPIGGDADNVASVAAFVDGKYSHAHKAGSVLSWVVSASLEIADAATWTESLYDVLLAVGEPEILEMSAAALHTLINETLAESF